MIQDLIQKYKSEGIAFQLIFWNVIIFIISIPIFYQFQYLKYNFPDYLVFNSEKWYFYSWTIVSYAFFHNGVLHLVFNMFFLYIYSYLFFIFFNSKQFIRIYIYGIIFSIIFSYIFHLVLNFPSYTVVGSSGAIITLFFACTYYVPKYKINILMLNIELWIIASVIFLYFITMLYSGNNQSGNLVHIGGAIGGILWGYYIKKGIEISGFLQIIFNIFKVKSKKSSIIKPIHLNKKNTPQHTQKNTQKKKIK
jgi:membrane associated rhomboid family serine protease